MIRQEQTPLLTAMKQYIEENITPFHTPGHKQGKGMASEFTALMGEKMLKYDLSLMAEWDDLLEPKNCILEAENLAAQLYGADHSYFVVNGTTGAIHAMILAVAGPGDKLIILRNSHRSVVGGMVLSGAMPVYVEPEVDPQLGLPMGVTLEALRAVLNDHPDAKGVLLTSPTYYGVASDLAAMSELVHSYGMPLLVDEAHGPHLKFHEALPLSALEAGADIVAQSTHKILGAMTQCSMLHCRGGRISLDRLRDMLKIVQSTSPNYILLASLEAARLQMASQGRRLIDQAIELSGILRSGINAISGLSSFGAEKIGCPGVHGLDPTKVTVNVSALKLTGAEAEAFLRSRYKIQVELFDHSNLLFLITFGDSKASIDSLLTGLRALAAEPGNAESDCPSSFLEAAHPKVLPDVVMSPRQAAFAAWKEVPFAEAAGEISAEVVAFYPPGIPIICPGEKITAQLIEYCRFMQLAGLNVSGPKDHSLLTIQVIDLEDRRERQ